MQCSSCQFTVQEGSKFCGECGASLTRICPSCNNSNPAGASFCSECGTGLVTGKAKSEAVAPTRETEVSSRQPHAEKRQITVMFCDMVGSSALSTQLDPEKYREVVGTFLSCCATEIKRLDGMVASYLGDGILAYFGYPTAHEDDAERAVRAGLAILDAVKKLNSASSVTSQVRVGIASGVVVIGDLVREGVTQRDAVIGETTNLASRLQTLAEPDTLVISSSTYELVGALFDYRDLDYQTVKGFAEPVHARQVLRLSDVANRFEARNLKSISRILGRDEEIELMVRRWEQAKAGHGRMVLVTGEAGIGKSRIGRAMEEHLQNHDHICLNYYCSSFHRDSALHPIIGQLTKVAGITHNDNVDEKQHKLRNFLEPLSLDLASDMPLYASMLSIPHSDQYPMSDLTPQQLKSRILAALITNLKRLAEQKPVLMVFEDLHWIDATSLELLTLAIDQVPDARLLLIATARPEFIPLWPRHSHISEISLGRLDNTKATALVTSVSKSTRLAKEVIEQIVERADGIPLYIEELTKTVLESGLLVQEKGKHRLSGAVTAVAIPPTLHASLIARLDRLSSAKNIAQIGAAIGRQFTHSLIATVADASKELLQDALDRLVDAELIFIRTITPEIVYEFNHALVHDAIYASLVASRRQHLHGRIAAGLEENFPELVANEPETLARHFTEAGVTDRAIELWQRAGERALSRCENKEALGHLRLALGQLLTLAEAPERDNREFQLQLALGAALMVAQGQSTPEVEQAYSRARSLTTNMEDSEELFLALMGMWRYYGASGAQNDAREVGELLKSLAERLGETDLRIKACMTLGITLYQLWEEMPRAIDLLRTGAELYEKDPPTERNAALFSLGAHPGFMCAMGSAQIAWLLGETANSIDWNERSLAIGKQLNNPFQRAMVHIWSAVFSHYQLNWTMLRSEIEAANELAVRHHIPACIAVTGIYSGLLKVIDGFVEEGLTECSFAVDEIDRMNYGIFRTRSLLILAQAYGIANRPDEGLEAINKAIKLFGAYGQLWIEPELHRVRGELLLKSGSSAGEEAMLTLDNAINMARSAGLPTFERRATISMAQARMGQGQYQAARSILEDLLQDWADDPQSAEWRDADALLKTALQRQT